MFLWRKLLIWLRKAICVVMAGKFHRPLVNKSKYIKFSEDDLHSEVFITSEAV